MTNRSKWQARADADLIRMRSVERKTWGEIAAVFGCSKTNCHARYIAIVPEDEQLVTTPGAHRKVWSKEAMAELNRLRFDEKKTYVEIAAIFGKSLRQISGKFERMRIAPKRIHFENPATKVIVPQACLDDRDRRYFAERELTAEFFGDPCPGFSALDRKKQGAAA